MPLAIHTECGYTVAMASDRHLERQFNTRFRDEVHDLLAELVAAGPGKVGTTLTRPQVCELAFRALAEKWGVSGSPPPVTMSEGDSSAPDGGS